RTRRDAEARHRRGDRHRRADDGDGAEPPDEEAGDGEVDPRRVRVGRRGLIDVADDEVVDPAPRLSVPNPPLAASRIGSRLIREAASGGNGRRCRQGSGAVAAFGAAGFTKTAFSSPLPVTWWTESSGPAKPFTSMPLMSAFTVFASAMPFLHSPVMFRSVRPS